MVSKIHGEALDHILQARMCVERLMVTFNGHDIPTQVMMKAAFDSLEDDVIEYGRTLGLPVELRKEEED